MAKNISDKLIDSDNSINTTSINIDSCINTMLLNI